MIQEPISISKQLSFLYKEHEKYFKGPPLGLYAHKYFGQEHSNFLIKLPKFKVILISIKDNTKEINNKTTTNFYTCLVRSIFGIRHYKINQNHLIKNAGSIQDCLRVLWGIFLQDITNDFYPINEEEILKTIKSDGIFSKLKNLMLDSDEESNETVSGSISVSIKTNINITNILESLKKTIKKKPFKFSFENITRHIMILPANANNMILAMEENILYPVQSINVLVSKLNENYEYFGTPIKNEFFPPEISKINIKNKPFDLLKIQNRFYDLLYSEQSYVMQLLEFHYYYTTLFNIPDSDSVILSVKSLVYQKVQDILLLHIDFLYKLRGIIQKEEELKDLNLKNIFQLMKSEKLFSNAEIKKRIDSITDKKIFKSFGKKIAGIFEEFLPKFSIYQSYITNSYDISEIIKSERFLNSASKLIKRKQDIIKSDFNQIIMIPLHRLSRYKLYFEDLESLLQTNLLVNIIIKISTFDNLIHKKREEAIRLKKNIKLYSLINNVPQQTGTLNIFLLQINLEKYLNESPLSLFLDSGNIIFTKRIGPKSDIFDSENDTTYEFIKKVSINNLKIKFKEANCFLTITNPLNLPFIKLPTAMVTASADSRIETIPLISTNPLIIEQFMRSIELYKNSEGTLKSKHFINYFNLKNKTQKIFYHIYNAKQYIKSHINSKNIILISEHESSNNTNSQSKFIIKSDKYVCTTSSLIIKIFKEENYILTIESSKNIRFSDFQIPLNDFETVFNKIITKVFNIHHMASPIEEGDNLTLFKQMEQLFDKMKASGEFSLIQPLNYLSGICYINSVRRLINYCINSIKSNNLPSEIFNFKVKPEDYNLIIKLKASHEKHFKSFDLNILLSIISIYFKKTIYEILTERDILLMGLCITKGPEFVKEEFPIENEVVPKKFLSHFFYLKNEYFIVFLRFFSNYYLETRRKDFISFFEFILRGQDIPTDEIMSFIDTAVLSLQF